MTAQKDTVVLKGGGVGEGEYVRKNRVQIWPPNIAHEDGLMYTYRKQNISPVLVQYTWERYFRARFEPFLSSCTPLHPP